MKIYQIHESSGMYDDYIERIVGSYLNKEKAIAKMEELKRINKKKLNQCDKCSECPIWEIDISDTLNSIMKKCFKHCRKARIKEEYSWYYEKSYEYYCDNYQGYCEECDYTIEEVEVEE